MRAGYTVDQIHDLTKIDKWFLNKLENIVKTYEDMTYETLEDMPVELLRLAKQEGFSDFQIQRAIWKDKGTSTANMDVVREHRKSHGIVPVVKQIDTLAAEFPAQTNYLYLTYNGTKSDIEYERDGKSVIVLGSGAYRIGSSVEFDWCSREPASRHPEAGLQGSADQLQPGDGLHRLRYVRQALFRRAHLREGDGHHRP